MSTPVVSSSTSTSTLVDKNVSMKGKEVKPKAKCSAYAYFVKSAKKNFRLKNPEEKINGPEFTRKLAEEWKVMSEKSKAEFIKLAETDKARYEKEMAEYDPFSEVDEKKRKRQATKEKDPNAPKRPLTAFFLYSSENREKVREQNKDLTSTEIAKELGSMWKQLTKEERDSYLERAEEEKKKYLVVLDKYKKSKMSSDEVEPVEDNKENQNA